VYSERENNGVSPLQLIELWAPFKSPLSAGWSGYKMFFSTTCSLQLAKAGSAAMLPQQEKKNWANVQRGGFICTVAS
jgi:hypothetical protein